jgi:ATP synthase protein I
MRLTIVRAGLAGAPAEAGEALVAQSRMSESGPPDPLHRLGERLARARAEQDQDSRASGAKALPGGIGLGFRMGIELVASLCVGLALGWVFDRFLGTRPWGLIVFFFLGAAAGMLNVFRAARGLGYGHLPPHNPE